MNRWRIGELAAELGVTPKTIRHYDIIGLLPAEGRTPSGYRVYGSAERDQLRFILQAKRLGLTLDEIREILGIRREGVEPCHHVVELLDGKLRALDEQLEALSTYRKELLEIKEDAARRARPGACVCRLIEHHEPKSRIAAPDVTLVALRGRAKSRR